MSKAKFEIREDGMVLMHLPHPNQSAPPNGEIELGWVSHKSLNMTRTLCELLQKAFEAGRAERSREMKELIG
jgi:hypothetical protein